MLEFKKTSDTSSPHVEISLEKIKILLKEILIKRFPTDVERQKILLKSNNKIIGFCCPYCGDSFSDPRKKRGNFYTKWLYYKCYNGGCEKYTDLISMLKHFNEADGLTEEETLSAKVMISETRDAAQKERILKHELSLNALTNTDFTRVLAKRDAIMESLKLQEIHVKSPMGVYLYKRQQNISKKFAWDPKRKRLFLFNMDASEEYVFSLQTRQFDNVNAKYLTYNLSGIWVKLLNCKDEEFLTEIRELDQISTLFGVLTINFNNMVTLFEGPMDAFLFPNSVGMCSINNSFPFDISNYRWFQDNDEAGKKKALEALGEGISVFLWRKFIDDNELHGKRLKDYNDIMIYQKMHNVDFGSLEKYFSTHRYDGINL